VILETQDKDLLMMDAPADDLSADIFVGGYPHLVHDVIHVLVAVGLASVATPHLLT
jgi:hypothetical protein